MLKRLQLRAGLFALAIASAVCLGSRPAAAELTNLDTFPGGSNAEAWDINNAGQVVGCATTSDGYDHAFLQAPTNPDGTPGTKLDLGTLPGDTDSCASGINEAGQVCGWSLSVGNPDDPGDDVYRAFLWTPSSPNGTTSGTMIDLGNLGGPGANAQAINDAGQVTGWSYVANQPFVFHAFVWTPGAPNGTTGTMADLGSLPDGFLGVGWSINNAGQVVGNSYGADGGIDAFLWNPGGASAQTATFAAATTTTAAAATGSMVSLGTLNGHRYSEAYDINDLGQVVGASYDRGFDSEAYLWSPAAPNASVGDMVGLGSIADGTSSLALGINESGQVVGWAYTDSAEQHAFVWVPAAANSTSGVLVDIGTLGGANSEAVAINDAGNIVGTSDTPADQTRPFVVTTPTGLRAEGFLAPVNSPLVPDGQSVSFGATAYRRNRTLPLAMRMYSGNQLVSGQSGGAAPRIVGLKLNGGAIALPSDLDAGSSSGNSYLFRPRGHEWTFELKTSSLALGYYEITIELPGGGLWSAGFQLR